ncbi:hypothetical protein NLU13_0226 [Sarocladium strictum]|uniref:DNA-(apurinic or apyrimidinic site) endonuclease 2 n=1 Tax=Sarocladium strictum TaxID=5046 RepID=A0AA39LB31_SARSR|nr:hypothetical protein NLU13_0226 [Sarocladium strictum]
MGLRITTWNVNGIRNPFGYQPWRESRTFQSMFDILEADIVIMQETKIQRKDLRDDMVLVPGWDVYFSLPKHKKGYSGVAIYTRNSKCAPLRAEEGVLGVLTPPKSTTRYCDLPECEQIGGYPRPGQLVSEVDPQTLDSEGRCVVLEFTGFVLFGVYSPANRDESRDDFRISFFQALDIRIRNLIEMGKQVILTGDLNVIGSEIDTTNLAETLRKEDMTMDDWLSRPTRRIFNQLIYGGAFKGPRDEGREQPVLWDLTRCFHPGRQGMNTCWDTKRNTRPANNGSRIDYILCSDGLKKWFFDSNIQEGLMGSDHCPVYADMKDVLTTNDEAQYLSDLIGPLDMFQNGQRLRDWSPKDLLPLSARLIPEFDGRRSIRDMFTRAAPAKAKTKDALMLSHAVSDTTASQTATPKAQIDGNSSQTSSGVSKLNESNHTTAIASHSSSMTPKRIADPPDMTARASKKSKANTDGPKRKIANGQKTLQGFFKREGVSSTSAGGVGRTTASATQPPTTDGVKTMRGASDQAQQPQPTTPTRSSQQPASATDTISPSSAGKIFDPIEAKESWSRLLGKRVVPRCEHNEPCISLLTKKPGVNCGRSFYICPRPLGPSGEKERGSEWRCGTFIWSSDWAGEMSTRGSQN